MALDVHEFVFTVTVSGSPYTFNEQTRVVREQRSPNGNELDLAFGVHGSAGSVAAAEVALKVKLEAIRALATDLRRVVLFNHLGVRGQTGVALDGLNRIGTLDYRGESEDWTYTLMGLPNFSRHVPAQSDGANIIASVFGLVTFKQIVPNT